MSRLLRCEVPGCTQPAKPHQRTNPHNLRQRRLTLCTHHAHKFRYVEQRPERMRGA